MCKKQFAVITKDGVPQTVANTNQQNREQTEELDENDADFIDDACKICNCMFRCIYVFFVML